MKTETHREYCTSEKETTNKSKKVTWFTFLDNDFADKVELDLQGRELIQENSKWFEVKKNINNNEHNSIDRNVNDICDDILINQVTAKVAIISLKSDVCDDEVELNLGDYKIEIRDNKTYAVLKKLKYPKTYEECCKRLIQGAHYGVVTDILFDFEKKLEALKTLIVCRNAYWKIAGEELGLNKPWEPDFSDDSPKYNIFKYENGISLSDNNWSNRILVFPTIEMRNAFYDNFKDLIEQCKELL